MSQNCLWEHFTKLLAPQYFKFKRLSILTFDINIMFLTLLLIIKLPLKLIHAAAYSLSQFFEKKLSSPFSSILKPSIFESLLTLLKRPSILFDHFLLPELSNAPFLLSIQCEL